MKRFYLVFIPMLLVACGGRSVTLVGENGRRSLTYDCSNYQSQAETYNDLLTIGNYMLKVSSHASKNSRVLVMQELSDAYAAKDYKKLEMTIVQYVCKYGLD